MSVLRGRKLARLSVIECTTSPSVLLMYCRLYITHKFLGFLFGLDDPNVGRNINPLEPLLTQVFRAERRGQGPRRRAREGVSAVLRSWRTEVCVTAWNIGSARHADFQAGRPARRREGNAEVRKPPVSRRLRKKQWALLDLNQGPLACEASALNR